MKVVDDVVCGVVGDVGDVTICMNRQISVLKLLKILDIGNRT